MLLVACSAGSSSGGRGGGFGQRLQKRRGQVFMTNCDARARQGQAKEEQAAAPPNMRESVLTNGNARRLSGRRPPRKDALPNPNSSSTPSAPNAQSGRWTIGAHTSYPMPACRQDGGTWQKMTTGLSTARRWLPYSPRSTLVI
jgi:hypothetical protein